MPGIHKFKRIGSTQERAKLLAEQGAPEGTIVRADRQTRGRGRFKRRWESPEGGLWFSMVLYPAIDPARAWQLTMVCAVALAAGIRKGAGIRVGLKWPNDIVYKTKKVGGILTETSAAKGGLNYAVIGFGINVNNVVPDGLEDKAISLKELAGEDIEVDGLLREILREFRKYYSMFRKNGISSVRPGYGRLSVLLGRRVEVKDGEKTIRGTAKDISCDGALIVRTDKTEHKIFSGDVTEVKGD